MWIFQLSDLWNVFPVCFQHDGSSYPFSLYRSMVYHANDLYPSPSMPNISLGRPASSSVSPPLCLQKYGCKFLKKRKITLFIEQEKERKFKWIRIIRHKKKKKNVFTVNSNFSLNKINIGNIKMGNKNFILGNCILRMRTCNNYFFLKGWGLIYFLIYMYWLT